MTGRETTKEASHETDVAGRVRAAVPAPRGTRRHRGERHDLRALPLRGDLRAERGEDDAPPAHRRPRPVHARPVGRLRARAAGRQRSPSARSSRRSGDASTKPPSATRTRAWNASARTCPTARSARSGGWCSAPIDEVLEKITLKDLLVPESEMNAWPVIKPAPPAFRRSLHEPRPPPPRPRRSGSRVLDRPSRSTSRSPAPEGERAAPIDRARAAARAARCPKHQSEAATRALDSAPSGGSAVSENMTPDQVRALLGPPDSVDSATTELWRHASRSGRTPASARPSSSRTASSPESNNRALSQSPRHAPAP